MFTDTRIFNRAERPDAQADPLAGVLFADDFDALDGALTTASSAAPAYTEIDLAAARTAGRAQGEQSARAAFAAGQAQAEQTALTTLAGVLNEADDSLRDTAEQHANEISRLVLAVVAQMLPHWCARHGEAEIVALAQAILPSLLDQPQLIIRCNPHTLPALQRLLADSDADLGQRVSLIPTDALAASDIGIRWQQGHATRCTRTLWRQVVGVLSPLDLIDAAEPGPAGTKPAQAAALSHPQPLETEDA